ncbi:MAG: PA0069 family radical SAM protein [Gammaproteobacteria bacterium]|nr:PA0069 family radical SAM protein [Gammaproteobacteria bacterium]
MTNTAHKGRGAVSQTRHRFEKTSTVLSPEERAADDRAPPTELRPLRSASIISHNSSPDIPFDHSINPYQGCEHGCVYCYARPTHSYFDLSPGLDFETQVFYKPQARATLLAEWEKPGYRCEPICIGANTDPYQPAEKKLQITRGLLETFLEHRHPVSIISKGTLMLRDIDLLEALAERKLCSVAISIPTAENALKRLLEPRVPAASARFDMISALRARNIPVSLMLAPVIPAVNDAEIESIVSRAALAGVDHASYILLRLPHELKQVFREWLDNHIPERAGHVMSLVRQASGGRDYDNRFGVRQTGRGPYARMIRDRFRVACKKNGLSSGRQRIALDSSQFRRPGPQQMGLDFN